MTEKKVIINKELFYQKAREKFGEDVSTRVIASYLSDISDNEITRVRINRLINGHNIKSLDFIKRLCDLVEIKIDELITYNNNDDNN